MNYDAQATGFDKALREAIAAITDEYIRIPIAGGSALIRERAFAYELYHQLRARCEGMNYSLTGELTKAGHPHLRARGLSGFAPDLLLHVPGDMAGNFVAIEIKGGPPRSAALRKDLTSLSILRDKFGYERLIYLIYGITESQVRSVVQAGRTAAAAGNRQITLERIELWVRVDGAVAPELISWDMVP